MDASERTRLEIEAGARQLASLQGHDLSPDYMDRIIRTQQRHAQLKKWDAEHKVEIEYTTVAANDHKTLASRCYVHVLDKQRVRFAAFEDLHAEQTGGWPSEVLMANVALALQSNGML